LYDVLTGGVFSNHAYEWGNAQDIVRNGVYVNHDCEVKPNIIAVTLPTTHTNTQQLPTTIPHVIQPLAGGEAWLAEKTSLPLPAQETQQFKIFSLQLQFI